MKYDVSLQTIAWLNGRRVDDTLEISPQFQRRPVWMEPERTSLMATICGSLPFPEIYVHHDTNPDTGAERHIVVDGQQRVTSILMFIDGEISLPSDDLWKGLYFRDMTPEQKTQFWDYKIVVRGLSQTNDAEIRDLFERLNTNNIALNDQEIRNAKYKGRFKEAAEQIADNPLFQSLGLFTARDIRRMQDVEYASELLLRTVEGVTNKKDLLNDCYAAYEEDFPREAEYLEEVDAAMGLLRALIDDGNKAQAKRKSNFYSLFGACLEYHRTTKRSSFKATDDIVARLTPLLNASKTGDVADKPEEYAMYFEAVSRAASDKGRRATREKILLDVILTEEKKHRGAA